MIIVKINQEGLITSLTNVPDSQMHLIEETAAESLLDGTTVFNSVDHSDEIDQLQVALKRLQINEDVGYKDGQFISVGKTTELLEAEDDQHISVEYTGISTTPEGAHVYTFTTVDHTPDNSVTEEDWDKISISSTVQEGMSYPDAIKSVRDQYLTLTDRIIIDPDLTAEQLTAWKTYRQDLRDLPAQAGFPDTITWPTKPV